MEHPTSVFLCAVDYQRGHNGPHYLYAMQPQARETGKRIESCTQMMACDTD